VDNYEPQLPHNKEPFDRILRQKRWLGGAILAIFPVAMLLVPRQHREMTIIILLVVAFAGFMGLELLRVRIYWRDLRERRDIPDT